MGKGPKDGKCAFGAQKNFGVSPKFKEDLWEPQMERS